MVMNTSMLPNGIQTVVTMRSVYGPIVAAVRWMASWNTDSSHDCSIYDSIVVAIGWMAS